MRWCEGGIAEAVAASKKKGAVFVVYVEGEDDKSKKLTSLIGDAEVSDKLSSDNFVAIKILANSVPHQQFEEIYKGISIPSIYFIGKAGLPVEIITDVEDASALSARIDHVLAVSGFPIHTPQAKSLEDFLKNEQQSSQSSSEPVASTAATHKTEEKEPAKESDHGKGDSPSTTKTVSNDKTSPAKTESQVKQPSSTETESKSSPPPNVVCENGVCTIQKNTESSKSESPTSCKPENPTSTSSMPESDQADKVKEMTHEDKVRRAQELIEQKRLQKQKEEEEKEKQKEIERRKMGQGVQQLKKWQEDQELKQIMEEREKEKRDNQAARQRVLAQIAQDKAERAVRFSSSPPAANSSPPQPQVTHRAPKEPTDYNKANLQFKLPDGSVKTHMFDAQNTLENVRSYIIANLNVSSRDFTLSTVFPRREFTNNDNSETLANLELVPNAVLLIRRPISTAVSTTRGGFTSIVWMIFSPIINILSYLKSMVFGGGNTTQAGGTDQGNKRPAQESDQPTTSYQAKRPRESTVIKRDGNVHRLSDRNDSDDENSTWNGNSTQQM